MSKTLPTDFIQTSKLMLKTKIAKLNLKHCVIWAANSMAKIENDKLDMKQGQWLPWNILTFIKYSAKFARAKKYGEKADVFKAYAYFHNHLRNKPDNLLETTGGVSKLSLRLAHQQFPFHDRITDLKYKIVRQHLFFSQFETEIIKATGISSLNFLKLCFVFFAHIEKGTSFFRLSDFTYLPEDMKDDAGKFLSYASTDLYGLAAVCSTLELDEAELYGFGLFTRHPFIQIDDYYILISSTYFCAFFSYGIYDALKSTKGGEFGTIFENYLSSELKRHFSNAILEKEIKKIPGSGKTCDAVLETANYIAMFEFKATELPKQIQQDPSNSFELMKKTLIKAIAQGYSTAKLLGSDNSPLKEAVKTKKTLLFIVSYKETFLGTAEREWDSFKPVLKSEYNIDSFSYLEPRDIFFISIDDFDWIMTLAGKIDDLIDMAIDRFAKNDAFTLSLIHI